MTKLELIQQNKKRYEDQIQKNEYMDGLSKLVGEYLMLPWIKGSNWMGGLSYSKANKAFEKIMLYGYDFDEIDDEWQKQMDEQSPLVESKLNENQYYGLNDNGDTVYVAMSEKEVINYAKKHPEEGIIRVEDKFKHGYNLKESYIITESLKKWDKKEFEDNSNSYELEMLYESVKNTLSAQQKNDLAKFVRKAKTADEINTFMTGMLAKEANESLQESGHFEYGNTINKANQAVDIIDFASDKNGNDIYLGSTVIVPQQLGYADREAQVEDIFINKHGVEMLRVKYNDSKTKNVTAKSCTLIESFNKEPHEFWYYTKHGIGPGTIPKDVQVLDIKEDDNFGTYIKLDKVLTTDELNYYDLKEKEPLTEDINEESFNKLKKIAYELDEYIEDKVWVRDFWFDGQFENTISFEIYGDWKHDHARFDYYASEWLDNKGLKYKMWENVTDDDGSDSYGATHTIRLYDFVNESHLEEGIKQDREKIIKSFIEQCLEKFNTFGDETDTELEVPDKLDNNAFYDDLEWEAKKNGIRLSVQETSEFPGGVYLYYHIRHDNLDEGYISQKDTKFSNGQLKDLSPDDLMQKVMSTGQSLNSVRKCGDDYYTIFVQYKDFFGPTGVDNPDTDYVLDIIKEDSSGNQDRVVLDSGKASDIIEKLRKFRDETCLVDDMKKNAAMPY